MISLKDENKYILLFMLLASACGTSIWLIVDKNFTINFLGFALFGISLGGLFLLSIEKIVNEIQNRHGVKQ